MIFKKKKYTSKEASRKLPFLIGAGIIAVFFCIIIFQGKGLPENPLGNKDINPSTMYSVSNTLAVDQSKFKGMENANVNIGKSDYKADNDKSQNDEKKDDQEKEENQNENNQSETESEDISSEENNDLKEHEDRNGNTAEDVDTSGLVDLIEHTKAEEQNETSDNGSGGGTSGGNTGGVIVIPGDGDASGITGHETGLDVENSEALFTTSIEDGKTVTEKDYPFTVTLTDEGRKLKVASATVTINGEKKAFDGKSYEARLKKGENKLRVTLKFRDNEFNQIVANSKEYTLYYVPSNNYMLILYNADTNEKLIPGNDYSSGEDEYRVRAFSRKGDKAVRCSIRLNNHTVNADEHGIYRLNLKLGKNKLTARNGSGIHLCDYEYYINYAPADFALSFESRDLNMKVTGDSFGGMTTSKYSDESESFRFRVSCTEITGKEKIEKITLVKSSGTTDVKHLQGADGYIKINLDPSRMGTKIKVLCKDNFGEEKEYTWKIIFNRTGTPENRKPVIIAHIADGETVQMSPYIIKVEATSWNGHKIYPAFWTPTTEKEDDEGYHFYLNGEKLPPSGNLDMDEYNLKLLSGENHIRIVAVDKDQYRAEKELTINLQTKPKDVTVRLIFDAGNIGLGELINTTVTVKGNTTVAQIVDQELRKAGYTGNFKGALTSADCYLASISKPGMLRGWNIPNRQDYEYQGLYIEGPDSEDDLGEFDFSYQSGWMVTQNGYFLGQSLGTRPVRDGDIIYAGFTLNYGKDLGIEPGSW